MGRLTKRNKHGQVCSNGRATRREILERCAFYEEAEAEGRLVVLPCKVGDRVYYIRRPRNFKKEKPCIHEMSVTKILSSSIDGEFRYILKQPLAFGFEVNLLLEHFGKTVFLTREEAEAALKGA